MAGRYLTKRLFKPRRGIDLKSSENNRTEDYLTNAQNVMYDGNGNLCKRNGYQLRIYDADAASGLVAFDTTDYAGNSKSELLLLGNSASSSPLRVVKNTLTITNTRIDASVTFSVLYDETTLQYRMLVTGAETADIAMGVGSGDLTIAGLIAALPLTQTGVASGDDTIPAAFIGIKQVTIQPGGSEDFEYYTTEELTWGGDSAEPATTVSYPTPNPSYAIVNRNIYWYKNHDSTNQVLYKYDGHVWYEAGLPFVGIIDITTYSNGDSVTDASGSFTLSQPNAWSVNSGDYYARLAYKDRAGVMHYGDFEDIEYIFATSTGAANGGIAFNIDLVSNPVGNKNARGIRVNGAQTNTLTITVDSGNPLIIGDIAYFYNSGAGLGEAKWIEREITNATDTSITISTTPITADDPGGAVDVRDNAMITNNFRVQYWKKTAGLSAGNLYRMDQGDLYAEVPLNVVDSLPDVIYPLTYDVQVESWQYDGARAYPPPSGRFVSSTSNGSSLIVSGNSESNNTVYASRSEDCESFYLGRSSFVVDEEVTALGSSGSVSIVGTKSKTYAVTGDIPSLNFRVEKITDNLGIRGHSTVAEVDEGLLAFNTIRGSFSLAGGRELRPVGEWPADKRISIIEPFFTYRYSTTSYAPNFDVASLSVVKEKKLIFNCCPSYYGSTFGPNDNITWVYDYSMGGWFVWFGVDMSFGSAYWDGKVWCAGHSPGGGVDVFSMNETNSDYDYSDHGSAIDAVIQYNWEAAGDSNIYKKYQWLTIYTPPGNGLPYNLKVKTYANYEIQKSTCFSDPTALHTSFEKYATPPAYTVEGKLKSGKMCSLLLEISNDSANEGLWLGGTEMDIAPVYQTPSRSGRSDS